MQHTLTHYTDLDKTIIIANIPLQPPNTTNGKERVGPGQAGASAAEQSSGAERSPVKKCPGTVWWSNPKTERNKVVGKRQQFQKGSETASQVREMIMELVNRERKSGPPSEPRNIGASEKSQKGAKWQAASEARDSINGAKHQQIANQPNQPTTC